MSIVGCMASLLISCDKNDNPVSDDVSDKDIVRVLESYFILNESP